MQKAIYSTISPMKYVLLGHFPDEELHRELKLLAPGYTAVKRQSLDLKLCGLSAEPSTSRIIKLRNR